MYSKTDYAYFAGVIDGEGHVGVRGAKGGGNQGFILCMADIPVLEWCRDYIGGTLSGEWQNERGDSRPRRIWKMSHATELAIEIPRVLPFLVLKREETLVLQRAVALTLRTRRRAGFAGEREKLLQELLTVRAARKLHRP